MIIEFLGFPGSGKTTIANKLINRLEESDYSVQRGTFDHYGRSRRIFSKLLCSIGCFFLAPRFYLKNIFFFIRTEPKSFFKDFLNITYLYVRYTLYKNSKKVIIFDQGLMQAYFSLACFNSRYTHYPYRDFLFNYVDIVINLELDEESNLTRLRRRLEGKSRLDDIKKTEYNLYYTRLKEIVDSISDNDLQRNTVTIDTSKNIDENVSVIIKKYF